MSGLRQLRQIHSAFVRFVILALSCVALTACSSVGPREYPDACQIRSDHPSWFRALRSVEQRWNVPPNVILAVMYQESRFHATARTPRVYKFGIIPWGRQSTAYGFAQALDGTWEWYQDETGMDGARRDNFSDAVEFMGWYMHKTYEKTGVSKRDAYRQYLAYHQGHKGYLEGRYETIRWLKDVAKVVEDRSQRYGKQLQRCY